MNKPPNIIKMNIQVHKKPEYKLDGHHHVIPMRRL